MTNTAKILALHKAEVALSALAADMEEIDGTLARGIQELADDADHLARALSRMPKVGS